MEKVRSEKVRAGNEVSDGEREKLKERKLLDEGEVIIWLYDNTLTGMATNLNVLTTKRVANIKGDNVFAARFDEIKAASYEAGGTSERIRVEKTNGEFVVLQFGLNSDSKRMFDSLCTKVPGKCPGTK